jgi:hypothetical protein
MAKSLIQSVKQAAKDLIGIVDSASEIRENDYSAGYDGVTVSMLLGTGYMPARSRIQILEKYHLMMGDPIISTALRTHVTQALGGHETSGDTIFIESKPSAKDPDKKRVEEIALQLQPLLNSVAHGLCFNAAGFGDAYARMFTEKGVGVTGLYTGEMLLPPLVQAYEQANTTTGFVVTTGMKAADKLTVMQMARMKMKRMQYVPQIRAMEMAQRIAIKEDDPSAWPHFPSLVGGSFLDAAESPYDKLMTAAAGLLSSRILGSIDESLMTVNTDGMTMEQRKLFIGSLGNMLKAGKERTRKLIEKGEFSSERVMHLMPVSGEKQISQVSAFQGSAGSSTICIDDLMLYARLLAGAIGIDLSLLGFADQLSGGLGDGGFFRTSIQAAERSEIIRTALSEFIYHVIDVHCLVRYGEVYPANARPFAINFYGATSALERETQETRERAANSAAVLLQVFQSMQELGLPEEMMATMLSKSLQLDDDYAQELAKGITNAKPKSDGPGGFGGGNNDNFEPDDFSNEGR